MQNETRHMDNGLNKKILGQTRKALQDYGMINDQDRIAVGISGGKDSMSMVAALSAIQKFHPVKFHLYGITIQSGLNDFDPTPICSFMEELGMPYFIEKTQIGSLVYETRKENNPCSLCANMRRGALVNVAKKIGCNKVALAHNREDVMETLLMSMFFEGRIHTFSPVTYMDRKDVHIIRPFVFCNEQDIKEYAMQNGFPVLKNPCPFATTGKRKEMKDLLSAMMESNSLVKSNLFGAIKRSTQWGW